MLVHPLVSIIIPLCDSEKSFEKALQSALNQTYPSIEILLITDQANEKLFDQAKDMILYWQKNNCCRPERKIHYLTHENQGIISCINEGLQKAKGDYLTILPPQDYFHEQRIEKIVKKMHVSGLHLAFTRVVGRDKNDALLPLDHPWKIHYERLIFDIIETPTLEMNFLNENIAFSIGNLIFSKKLFNTIGRIHDYKFLYNLDFILRAIHQFEISFINDNLYFQKILDNDTAVKESKPYKDELNKIQMDYFLRTYQQEHCNPHAPKQEAWFQRQYVEQQTLRKTNLLEQLVDHPANSHALITNSKIENKNSPPSSKKITLITQNLTLGGGVPQLVLDLSKILSLSGYQPKVLSFSDGSMRTEFEKNNIPVQILPKFFKWAEKNSKIKKLFSLLLLTFYLHMKTEKQIIINSSSASQFALPFALCSKFKQLIWYVHESFSPIVYLNSAFEQRLLKKAVNKKTFNFWFGSESTKSIWQSAIGVEGKVMYWSGISSTGKTETRQKPIKNLLAIGTVNRRKGTHYLIDAFIDCVKNKRISEDVTLTIIGIPKNIDLISGEIILKVYEHHLQNRIKLISCISAHEMEHYYKESDLFLQTSTLECLPLSLLKAMSAGIPIISTDVNGCIEAITHEENGYLCPPFSSRALAEMIGKAVCHSSQTQEMGLKGQQTFNEKFCLSITGNAIIQELNAEKI